MKLKNILLLPMLAIACTGCNNDPVNGELTLTGAANEIQLEIGGNNESVDYTKAIASESENMIENLDVYIFASETDGGNYRYLEKWQSAAENNKTLKTFLLQASGAKWNASVFPTEVTGYPFLKLFLVANRENNLYKEDGAATLTLTSFTNGTDFAAATDEATFLQSYTEALGAAQRLQPSLLMSGNGKTKMLGTVSNLKIELQRVVARFDIDNTARTSNLTIESIALKQGRKTGTLWSSGTLTPVAEGAQGTSPLLMEYKDVDYTALTNANNGVSESAIYTYPTLATDKASLIIKGKYRDPASGSEKAATYTVPLQKTDGGIAADIAIQRNNRYKLHIINVTNTTMAAAFEIEDWTSGGGITVKPEVPLPPATFTATGAAEVADDKIRVGIDGGTFTLAVSHTSKPVTIETTPTYETTYGGDSWLTVAAPVSRAAGSATATVTVASNTSLDAEQKPHEVHIGYITVKWGELPQEQMKIEIYRGASFVTYLDTRTAQAVRFAAVKMKDDRYWAPINVGATNATNKAATSGDITAACGKLFQWGRYSGVNATDNPTDIYQGPDRPVGVPGGGLPDMSKWDNMFIKPSKTDPNTKRDWLQYKAGLDNSGGIASAWYQQLWNANEGVEGPVVKVVANDPCPKGWRIPALDELGELVVGQESWDDINKRLKVRGKESGKDLLLPAAGRLLETGASFELGITGYYQTVDPYSIGGNELFYFNYEGWLVSGEVSRSEALSVRCIQE